MTINNINDAPTTAQLKAEYERRKYKKEFFGTLSATIGSVMVFAAAFVLICNFVFPVLKVTGSSMSPTISSNETVLCSKTSSLEKGDIIAFYHNKKILIKRIIGTADDVIDISDDGTVRVNGTVQDEPYIINKGLGECDISFPYTVPGSRYFVMGDDRTYSVDSRYSEIGCVAEEDVIGKVSLVVWPLGDLRKPK